MKMLIKVLFCCGLIMFIYSFFAHKAQPTKQLTDMVGGIGVMVATIGYKYILGIGETKE